MQVNEKALVYFNKEYSTFSVSISCKDKDDDKKKHVCYMSLLFTDKNKRDELIEECRDENCSCLLINIKKGFMGAFLTKKDEVKPQIVIQEFKVEKMYSK